MDLFEAYDNGFSSETNLISPHVIISDTTHVYTGLRLLHLILSNDSYAIVYRTLCMCVQTLACPDGSVLHCSRDHFCMLRAAYLFA